MIEAPSSSTGLKEVHGTHIGQVLAQIQDNHIHEVTSAVVQNVGKDMEFKVGMTFNNEDEAYNAYIAYGILKGFGVRKSNKRFNKVGTLTTCEFVCSCQGKSATRAPEEEIIRYRLDYRCGCEAKIQFRVVDGQFVVSKYNDIHNHEMVEDSQKHCIPSGRKLSQSSKKIIGSLVDSGVRPTTAFRYMTKEAGGIENLGFIEEDVHNFTQKRRKSMLGIGDAQSLIDHFKLLQSKDTDFFYTFQLDDEGHLCNLFWRDSVSKLYYECFGDVVTFDTTYRTNKYNLICAPFVGVNNHWKNVFFGCAFLGDETTSSFEWLFQTFLDAMDGKQPVTIFTDQDQAMAKAIKTIMPSTRHRLCEWHIEKNAAQRIPHLFGKPEFRDKYFNKLLWGCESEVDFDALWIEMTEKWNTKDNSWLNKLYDLKEKWSPAFNRDSFSADIRSTQRSESTNRVFNDFSCRSLTLVEFITRYEEKVKDMRIKEARHDFISRGMPKSVHDGIGISDHAGRVFTFTIFKKFQVEFLQAAKLKILSMCTTGNCIEFVLQLGEDGRPYKVQYYANDETIICSCHMFETRGWLCSHALRIMHFHVGLSHIPSHYILKRWTKAAKQGVAFEDHAQKTDNTSSSSITVRHSKLTKKSFAIMSLAACDEHTEAIANRYLDLARAEIIEYQNRITDVEQCEETVHDSQDNRCTREDVILDPNNRRRKGAPNLRMKSAIEKKRKKTTTKKTRVQVDNNNMSSATTQVPLNNTAMEMSGAFEQQLYGNSWISTTDVVAQNRFMNEDTQFNGEHQATMVERCWL